MKKVLKIFMVVMILILLSFSQGFQAQVFADDGSENESKTIDDVLGEADAFLNTGR